jgi:hypothetical protein
MHLSFGLNKSFSHSSKTKEKFQLLFQMSRKFLNSTLGSLLPYFPPFDEVEHAVTYIICLIYSESLVWKPSLWGLQLIGERRRLSTVLGLALPHLPVVGLPGKRA